MRLETWTSLDKRATTSLRAVSRASFWTIRVTKISKSRTFTSLSSHKLTLSLQLATMIWQPTGRMAPKSHRQSSPIASGSSQTQIYPTMVPTTTKQCSSNWARFRQGQQSTQSLQWISQTVRNNTLQTLWQSQRWSLRSGETKICSSATTGTTTISALSHLGLRKHQSWSTTTRIRPPCTNTKRLDIRLVPLLSYSSDIVANSIIST